MRDVVFVVLIVGFFAVAAAYVRACASVGAETAAELGEQRDDEDAAA